MKSAFRKSHCDMLGKWRLNCGKASSSCLIEGMPEIGDVEWMGISPEGTLMVTDRESHQAHEISYRDLTGTFAHSGAQVEVQGSICRLTI